MLNKKRTRLALIGAGVILLGAAAAQETAYQKQCAKCHASASRLARKLEGVTREEKIARLDKFLEKHQQLDATMRNEIARYLANLPQR